MERMTAVWYEKQEEMVDDYGGRRERRRKSGSITGRRREGRSRSER
jgi:hypothetical protein